MIDGLQTRFSFISICYAGSLLGVHDHGHGYVPPRDRFYDPAVRAGGIKGGERGVLVHWSREHSKSTPTPNELNWEKLARVSHGRDIYFRLITKLLYVIVSAAAPMDGESGREG